MAVTSGGRGLMRWTWLAPGTGGADVKEEISPFASGVCDSVRLDDGGNDIDAVDDGPEFARFSKIDEIR